MPEVRFSGFVHYLCKVVGWQLGKWDWGEIFWRVNIKPFVAMGWGGGFFWKNGAVRNFVVPG